MSEDPISVIYKNNILFVHNDGRLEAVGPEWRSCPRLISDKPCPHSSTNNPMPPHYDKKYPKCKKCIYSGVMYLKDEKQALDVARLIYPRGMVI